MPEAVKRRWPKVAWATWAERGEQTHTRYWDVDHTAVWGWAADELPALGERVVMMLAAEFPDTVGETAAIQ
jgi:uncharacterized protein with HEPN domain